MGVILQFPFSLIWYIRPQEYTRIIEGYSGGEILEIFNFTNILCIVVYPVLFNTLLEGITYKKRIKSFILQMTNKTTILSNKNTVVQSNFNIFYEHINGLFKIDQVLDFFYFTTGNSV